MFVNRTGWNYWVPKIEESKKKKSVEQKPVKIGIVGCGRATTSLHLPALRFVPGAQVVALADSNQNAFHGAVRQVKGARCVSDYRHLLEDRTIDAIAICVPAQFHVEIALAALEAGKHLFIEKPLALALEECDRLINRAAGSAYHIMVGFNTRWHRLARQARLLIGQGTLGPLEAVRSVLTSCHKEVPEWRKRRLSGGGVFLEMAMHHFDLWRFLFREEVEEISAHSRSGIWEDEAATVTARFRGGALASATFAECTSQNNTMEIYGREGSLSLSFYQFDGIEISTTSDIPGNIRGRLKRVMQFVRELPRAVPILREGGEWHQTYVQEWQHFVDSVRTGRPVGCGLEDGRQAVAIALAAAESAATGKTVIIDKR
jgi:myo-inositol 2-dehydrogenase/D-chiro-inositol 1-dehydrogenase